MQLKKIKEIATTASVVGVVLITSIYVFNAQSHGADQPLSTEINNSEKSSPQNSVRLTDAQLNSVSIAPVGKHVFTIERDAVGVIDFNEDMTVQVSTPYQGRVVELSFKAGDDVRKGQTLFTIDSPDLVQAESTVISSEGVLTLTSSVLARAKGLYDLQGLAQKDYQQAVSDHQAAEAVFKAACDAVRIFGKTDAEIDQIAKQHNIDAKMPVPSPISGRVTARNAAPGTLVQPGTAPSPFTISNLSTKWMLASVAESDLPLMRLGQAVDVKLMAYPDRTYHGKITNIGAAVDPNTHRVTIRSEVLDPKNEMKPQMFATFTVHTGDSVSSLALPYSGIVREGDGTMTVWATKDRREFTQRIVKIGLQQSGQDQILEGLKDGELVATDGALFISNALILGSK